MVEETRTITEEEARRIIAADSEAMSFLGSHGGFFKPDMPFSHPVHLPNGVIVWPPCEIHPCAKLGKDVMLGRFTNICGAVTIGEGTRIQGFCFIPEGITIKEKVFVGPNVTFTNMMYPEVRTGLQGFGKTYDKIIVQCGASIGAGAIIGPGVTIGENALVGMGSVVTRDVMPGWLVKGNPARHIRKLS